MEEIRAGNLSCKGKIALSSALVLSCLGRAASQALFAGRMEDQPAIERRIAQVVKVAREGGKKARLKMIRSLILASEAFKTMEVGKMIEGFGKAAYEGAGIQWDDASRVAASSFLHALPEIQEWKSDSRIHLTVRLLLPVPLPRGLKLVFRILDPVSGKALAEKWYPGKIRKDDILNYEVTLPFDMSRYPPGKYIAEAEFRVPGREVKRPDIENLRREFFVLEGFDELGRKLGVKYIQLKQKLNPRPGVPDTLAFLVALLGEMDRTVNPGKGNPPLVDIDQGLIFGTALWWAGLISKGIPPQEETIGDMLIGVRSAKGIVMPMRVYVPPSLPGPGYRKALLFIPDATGDENDLLEVYGKGMIRGLANRHGIILASLRSGYSKGAGDVLGPARETLVRLFGVNGKAITICGHGRGASHALYEVLARPGLWNKIVMVSGPPVDPGKPAPLPGKKTMFVCGSLDPGREYLETARRAASKGKCVYVEVPFAERFLALAFSLDKAVSFASK